MRLLLRHSSSTESTPLLVECELGVQSHDKPTMSAHCRCIPTSRGVSLHPPPPPFPNSDLRGGRTALHCAARRKHLGIMVGRIDPCAPVVAHSLLFLLLQISLLQAGADPNAFNERTGTPLCVAIRKKFVAAIPLLLQHGATLGWQVRTPPHVSVVFLPPSPSFLDPVCSWSLSCLLPILVAA
jgi:ankyrin repeat protein